MNPLYLCPLLAVLPVFGGQATRLASIALYTQFQLEPPPMVLESLRSELQAIMLPVGLRFEWRDLAAADGTTLSVELAVINFKGRCDVADLAIHSLVSGPLGWTHMSDGVILPYADVDCAAVRSFVQSELRFSPPQKREQVFGRALARVLAHELYHIFANTTRHGSEGVGRQFYSVQDLMAPDFLFRTRESDALKSSKAHDLLMNSQSATAVNEVDAAHRNP